MPTQRKNRQLRATPVNDAPTRELHMLDVVATTMCVDHMAEAFIYCWNVEGLTGNPIVGICNSRARRAGFNHPISPEAMSGRR